MLVQKNASSSRSCTGPSGIDPAGLPASSGATCVQRPRRWSQSSQDIGHRVRSLASEIEMIQGIVAPDTHHEITGIMGQPLILRYDSQCSIAIQSQQGNAPI